MVHTRASLKNMSKIKEASKKTRNRDPLAINCHEQRNMRPTLVQNHWLEGSLCRYILDDKAIIARSKRNRLNSLLSRRSSIPIENKISS